MTPKHYKGNRNKQPMPTRRPEVSTHRFRWAVPIVLVVAIAIFFIFGQNESDLGQAMPTAGALTQSNDQSTPQVSETVDTPATTALPVNQTPSSDSANAPPTPVEGPLPPLPYMQQMAGSREDVLEAYAFAARYPEVLRYVPCYCGCENDGHGANDDCFVASRDGEGRVTGWDRHGMT